MEKTVRPYPSMNGYTSLLGSEEESMKYGASMDKVYEMLQELFEREEKEQREGPAKKDNEETDNEGLASGPASGFGSTGM